ncbi:MAG TPA: amidase [Terriglobia bacterium]|nr:amidase [Terriglobia bacterium]
MHELCYLSATEIAAQIRQRKISPREVVQAYLDRIGRLNPQLNALTYLDSERALESARAAEAALAKGLEPGPLHGVPVTVKSSIDVAGWPCESGTRLRAGNTPAADAPLAARLRKAGAILLGNTNTPELLMAYETDNLLYGRTNNPWDLGRTPGGSSGGESAAIAAGLSAGGVGSDGGGSIRVPAHFTGICGLKPTPGRIPATGHFPASLGPFTLTGVVGPLARTAADLKLMFEVIAGPDVGDPSSAPVPVKWIPKDEIRKLRIGWFEDDGRTPITPETRNAVRRAAQSLAAEGFIVEPFRPEGLERARQLWWNIFGRVGGMILAPAVNGCEKELSPILNEFLAFIRADVPLTLQDLIETWMERDQLRIQLLTQMEEFPVLLCPVCAIPAFRHSEREWTVEGKSVNYLDVMSYSQWFNLLGNPAAVVPVGRSAEGLPIGVQVVGRPYEEEAVLAIAAEIEERCGGWQQPPLDCAAQGAYK